MNIEEFIKVSAGKKKADLLLKNARVVNVLSNEILNEDVAVFDGLVCGVGKYSAREVIDLKGKLLLPGYIDGHIHIESSMVTVSEFARTVVPLGTTAVVADPHEIANVLGLDGIKYMLDASKYQPLDVFFMMPSCVPSTSIETSGAVISAGDIFPYLSEKWVVGLGEMMNYPGVINCDMDVLDKIKLVTHKKIDGHAPGLTGKSLSAYIAVGIKSDHESTSYKEAREKLRKGMHIMIREGTATKNLDAILPLVNSDNANNFSFVSDDRSPKDLILDGHMNHIVRKAIERGLNPITAVKLATINTARYFNIPNIGAIAPGYIADMQVLSSFRSKIPSMVFKSGKLISSKGRIEKLKTEPKDIHIRGSVNVKWLELDNFKLKVKSGRVRVIKLVPEQIVTQQKKILTPQKDGYLVSDPRRDLLKICVVDRHRSSGNVGIGLINGMGLKSGAIATSIAHDSHNIVSTGVSDEDILTACVEVVKMGGGVVYVENGRMVEKLELPIAGLMSELPIADVNRKLNKLISIVRAKGAKPENPYFILSFLSLPVVPELKITDKGLVDVRSSEIIELFC